eukprot:scaffold25642_cov146-Isochrysis_galbana.AAC.1
MTTASELDGESLVRPETAGLGRTIPTTTSPVSGRCLARLECARAASSTIRIFCTTKLLGMTEIVFPR